MSNNKACEVFQEIKRTLSIIFSPVWVPVFNAALFVMIFYEIGREDQVMWGVYETDISVHVIPCDDEGNILDHHIIDDFCICRPEAIDVGADTLKYLLSHNEIH